MGNSALIALGRVCTGRQVLELYLTRPDLSSLLLAPLAKVSGGLESCGVIFRDQTDQCYWNSFWHQSEAALPRAASALR